jgi:hypothetical protein
MHSQIRQFSCALAASVLFVAFGAPSTYAAQASPNAGPADHLVPPSALQQSAVNASRARQRSVESLQKFFSSPEAQKALQANHINPEEVKRAVSGLSDQEAAQLAQRANKAQSDFAAGDLSNHDLLLIPVFIAALILIIVAVH